MQTSLLSLLALSAGALATPSAPAPSHAFSCADATEGFAWSMTGFTYNATEIATTPAHQIVDGEVAFHISNPGLASIQASSACSAQSVQYPDYFYGDVVYDCVDPVSDSGTKTTFSFDATTGLLNINQSWTCANLTDPISFYAAGSANLRLTTTSSSYTNPNWTLGETFSNNSRYSTAKDGPILAYHIAAIA